jgi:hypothetical protein
MVTLITVATVLRPCSFDGRRETGDGRQQGRRVRSEDGVEDRGEPESLELISDFKRLAAITGNQYISTYRD